MDGKENKNAFTSDKKNQKRKRKGTELGITRRPKRQQKHCLRNVREKRNEDLTILLKEKNPKKNITGYCEPWRNMRIIKTHGQESRFF
jgi:hypothetical protein